MNEQRMPVPAYQPRPAGQQFLHHALLEGAGLVTTGFEGGNLGVHVGEDGGDGGKNMFTK